MSFVIISGPAAMPYAIVAERQGLSIYNRAERAVEALELAIARRRAGAEAVYVRDRAWELVPASVLERAAQSEEQRGAYAAPSPDATITVKVGAAPDAAPGSTPQGEGRGRVRIFKAAGPQRSRG